MSFLAKNEFLDLHWDPGVEGWICMIRKKEGDDLRPFLLTAGRDPKGVLEAATEHLESAVLKDDYEELQTMLKAAEGFENTGGEKDLSDMHDCLGRLGPEDRWEWAKDLREQLTQKVDRLKDHPKLLKNGIEWHVNQLRQRIEKIEGNGQEESDPGSQPAQETSTQDSL